MISIIVIIMLLFIEAQSKYASCMHYAYFKEYYNLERSDCFEEIRNPGTITRKPLSKTLQSTVYDCTVLTKNNNNIKVVMKITSVYDEDRKPRSEPEILNEISKIQDVNLPIYYGCVIDRYRGKVYMFIERLEKTLKYEDIRKNDYKNFDSGENQDTQIPYSVIEAFFSIARTFNKVHKLGIGHFDIKPDNLMIKENSNDIKPIDFGFGSFINDYVDKLRSKINSNTGLELKDSKQKSKPSIDTSLPIRGLKHEWVIKGTGGYVDPAMLQNGYTADLKSDVYSLGITFIELLFDTSSDIDAYLNKYRKPNCQRLLTDMNKRDIELLTNLADKITDNNDKIYFLNLDNKLKDKKSINTKIQTLKQEMNLYIMLMKMIESNIDDRITMQEVVSELEKILRELNPNSIYFNEASYKYDYLEKYEEEFEPNLFVLKDSYENDIEVYKASGIEEILRDHYKQKSERFEEDNPVDWKDKRNRQFVSDAQSNSLGSTSSDKLKKPSGILKSMAKTYLTITDQDVITKYHNYRKKVNVQENGPRHLNKPMHGESKGCGDKASCILFII